MTNRRTFWILGGAAGLSVALTWFSGIGRSQSQPPPRQVPTISTTPPPVILPAATPVALQFDFEDRAAMAYRYDIRSRSDLDVAYLLRAAGAQPQSGNASAGQRQRVDVVSSGTLNLRFFRSGSSGWDVAARLTDLTYTMANQPAAETGGMQQPFSFKLKPEGGVDEVRFTAGVSLKAREAVRQILSWFQVVLPKEARSGWSSQETDATGTYLSQYAVKSVVDDQATVSKKKLLYSSLANTLTPNAADTAVDVVESTSEYQFPVQGSWITQASIVEKLSLRARGRVFGKVESTGKLQRLEQLPAAMFADNFEAFRQKVDSAQYLASKYYETNPALDALWGHLTMSEAVQSFVEMFANQQSTAEALMVNFLRQRPSRSAELVRLLDSSTKGGRPLDSNVRLTLWRLNATAGHREAQRAQLDAALAAHSSRTTRMNALAHMDFENPEPFVPDELLRFRRAGLHSNDPSERELGGMALLALGAMGDARHPNGAMSQRIGQDLTGYLAATKQPSDTIAALQAIGNSGNPRAIDAIQPFLSSDDPDIRINAISAFRRMDDAKASEIVMQQFDGTTDPALKQAALKSLSSMPATAQTMSWATSSIDKGMDERTLALTVEWVGSQLQKFPGNETFLRRLLAQNPAFEVKRSILKFIAP